MTALLVEMPPQVRHQCRCRHAYLAAGRVSEPEERQQRHGGQQPCEYRFHHGQGWGIQEKGPLTMAQYHALTIPSTDLRCTDGDLTTTGASGSAKRRGVPFALYCRWK